jgi:hypothetical protein
MKLPFVYCIALEIAIAPTSVAQIATSQYDNSRTGATLTEKILTLQNVNATRFGKLGAFKTDGVAYAQPLFISSVEISNKGTHDVLSVATEHDSVYAFDANRPGDPPLWQVNFLDPKRAAMERRPVAVHAFEKSPYWAAYTLTWKPRTVLVAR